MSDNELKATDEEIALWFNRLREAHDSISRESEWEPPDPSVVLALQALEGCINRLDAAERERDALKAAMPKVTASDRECADKVSECFGANEHGEMTFDYDKAQAIIAAHIDKRIAMECDARHLVTVDAMEHRVAEAVRPWREVVGPLTNAVDDLRPYGTADALRWAQLVRQARALLSKEADSGTV